MVSSKDNNTMGGIQPPESRRPCSRGCGFFGSAGNRGLCSRCYDDYLRQKIAQTEVAMIGKSVPTEVEVGELVDALNSPRINSESYSLASPVPGTPVETKNRCGMCKKKVGLLGFDCRCGGRFCGMHRYPEAHPCTADSKAAGKIAIQKQNPVCKADKITRRV